MTKISEHFSTSEFQCKCCAQALVDPRLIDMLERVRELYGSPMRVLSGYRCPSHNRACGGVDNSYHTQGMAADIQVSSGTERMRLVRAAFEAGCRRIGVYRQEFVHLDVGESPADVMWVG